MSEVNQKERLSRIVGNALDGSTYESTRSEEDGKMLVLQARRSDGRQVNLRFRAVRESEATADIEAGSPLRLKSVGSGTKRSILGLLVPILRTPAPQYSRVTIEAGAARLQVVCQDVEWWEN
jgi:hypothetical protein